MRFLRGSRTELRDSTAPDGVAEEDEEAGTRAAAPPSAAGSAGPASGSAATPLSMLKTASPSDRPPPEQEAGVDAEEEAGATRV